MPTEETDQQSLLISYLTLRKWVGFLGILLPFVLITGNILLGNCSQVQASISHYYYTFMGTYFTGTLCAVALFLFCYKGYSREDNIVANLAAIFSVTVAFFPTDPDLQTICTFINRITDHSVSGIHYTAAGLLFACFAWFCLRLFVKTDQGQKITVQKKARNFIYMTCGLIIILCILFIGAYNFFWADSGFLSEYKPTLVFETIALVAFGSSWIIKGEFILKDK